MYWQRTRDGRVLDSLRRSVEFYAHCVHPDGSVGGVYGSRHTSLYFPGGFEILAGEIPAAAAVAAFLRDRFSRGNVVTPATADAENLIPMLYSYLQAAVVTGNTVAAAAATLPCRELDGVRRFTHSGITVAGTKAYYAVVHTHRGGVCRVFDRGPAKFLLLRMLNLTLFRSRTLGTWLRNRIVARLIMARHPGPFRLRREVRFQPDAVCFVDRVDTDASAEVDALMLPRSFTGIHMGSAKYFHAAELEATQQIPVEAMLDTLKRTGGAENRFTVSFAARRAEAVGVQRRLE